jgi:hypothetical protein
MKDIKLTKVKIFHQSKKTKQQQNMAASFGNWPLQDRSLEVRGLLKSKGISS